MDMNRTYGISWSKDSLPEYVIEQPLVVMCCIILCAMVDHIKQDAPTQQMYYKQGPDGPTVANLHRCLSRAWVSSLTALQG